jgi:ParB/RepB/Spo0J family partition protein
VKRAQLTHLDPKKIRPGRNVRVSMDGIEDLAASLLEHGMLQAITVVPTEDGDDVEVLFGHRRHTAALLIDMAEIPCFLRQRATEQNRLLAQAAENFDRQEMSPLDEARLFRDLVDSGLTQIQVATRTRRSQAHVSRTLLLLRYPEVVQMAVNSRRIGLWDALAIPLSLLKDDKAMAQLPSSLGSGAAVRGWIGRHVGTGPGVRRDAVPYWSLKVREDLRDKAKRAAKARDVPLVDWVEQAIADQARRESR